MVFFSGGIFKSSGLCTPAKGGEADFEGGKQKGSERKMARGEGNVGTPDQRGGAPKVGLLYEFPERKPG